MLRYLRIAACIVSLTACVLFAAFWVRSHYWHDWMAWDRIDHFSNLISWKGQITCRINKQNMSQDRPAKWHGTRTVEHEGILRGAKKQMMLVAPPGAGPRKKEPFLGFGWRTVPISREKLTYSTRIWIPHWFLATVAGMAAIALKPSPRLKFSLRELLTIMTVFGVVLGGMAALTRYAE